MWPSEIPCGAANVSRPPAAGVSRPSAVDNDLHHAGQRRPTPVPRPSPGPPGQSEADRSDHNEDSFGTDGAAQPEETLAETTDAPVEDPGGATLGSRLDLSG